MDSTKCRALLSWLNFAIAGREHKFDRTSGSAIMLLYRRMMTESKSEDCIEWLRPAQLALHLAVGHLLAQLKSGYTYGAGYGPRRAHVDNNVCRACVPSAARVYSGHRLHARHAKQFLVAYLGISSTHKLAWKVVELACKPLISWVYPQVQVQRSAKSRSFTHSHGPNNTFCSG